MALYYEAPGVQIFHGDCREVLPTLGLVDTCITDPPYGLGFMGKGWDHAVPGVEFWTAVSRTLKPGGHLLAFGGTRLWHRLAIAIEDAGFEIRDTLMWLYGSGFPKSLDVSKAIDKAAGAENVVGTKPDRWTGKGASLNFATDRPQSECKVTEPTTDAAKLWQGYGTALKPAWEPILLARKPLEGTVAANVQAHGAGALNIDGCRIGDEPRINQPMGAPENSYGGYGATATATAGRWPANLILDEDAARLLDEQSGELTSGMSVQRNGGGRAIGGGYGIYSGTKDPNPAPDVGYRDTGGASRFLYTAKASRAERERYLDDQPATLTGKSGGAAAAAARGEDYDNGDSGFNRTVRVRNDHPTVKPLDLMRWLARLTKSPNGGTVLDPFMGSGSTLVAAREEFRPVIGIELDERYCEIAARRLSQGVLDFGAA